MPDKVEAPDSRVPQHRLDGLDQERDRYFGHVLAGGLPASRCVIGEKRALGEGGLKGDVGIVFLRRAEAVQEDDGGEVAARPTVATVRPTPSTRRFSCW